MDVQETWEKALKNTEIIRPRVQSLMTFKETLLPYVFLADSAVNIGDTVMRTGEVTVERPALILPPNIPHFEGFEFDRADSFAEDAVVNLLLVRGVTLPSMKYNNKTASLELYEGPRDKAVAFYLDQLQKGENVHTGLVTGPEDCWQFSVLIYVCAMAARNAETDIRKLLEEFRKKSGR